MGVANTRVGIPDARGAPVRAMPALALVATGVHVASGVSISPVKAACSVGEMISLGGTLGVRSEVAKAMAAMLAMIVKMPPTAVQMRCSEVSLSL
jgi:hypothetical protein